MYLDDAWFERGWEALLESMNFDNRTRRTAIEFLYDEGFWDREKLSWDAAEKRFRDCCNRNKSDANWKITEVWALMKRFGRHHFLHALAEDLGYELRQKSTPERLQDLAARAVDLLERHEILGEQLRGDLSRLLNGETAPAAKVTHLPPPRFSKTERGF